MHSILAPISLGELIDKITILEIKSQCFENAALANVLQELSALRATLDNLEVDVDVALISELKSVNMSLWHIEDAIREQERRKIFGSEFIELARSVYRHNDKRAAIKKVINIRYGSPLREEKSYQDY